MNPRSRSVNFTCSCRPLKGNARATAVHVGTPVAAFTVGSRTFSSALEQRGGRAMTMVRVAIGGIWLFAFVAGRQVWTPTAPLANTATSAEITLPPAPLAGAVAGESLVETRD